MVDEERMETLHLFVVREDGLPPKDDYLSLAIAFFSFLALVYMVLASLLVPPVNHDISFTTSVHSFPLPPLTKREKVQATPTGKGYTPATYASGTITFYNGAIYTQIIPVGTILKGADGIAVITDQEAAIPPAAQTSPPTYGHVSVPAHALVTGTSGNMQAGDINMACCVTSVIAQNPYTFTGGKNAQAFTYLTTQDIHHAVTSVLSLLQATTIAGLGFVLDPTCQTHTQVNGVTVSVTETCTGLSYHPQSVVAAITLFKKKLGLGNFSHLQTQIVGLSKGEVKLYVTALWNPMVVRRYPAGK